MKKFLWILVVLVMVFAGTALVSANGGPHGDYSATTDACAGCHRKTDRGVDRFVWVGIGTGCTDCHRNPHGTQFDRAGVPPDCRRCHTLESWKKLSFDHDRDSTFRVDGAHERVPCAECHRSEKIHGEDVVRYRPLPSDCKACHGETSGSTSALVTEK